MSRKHKERGGAVFVQNCADAPRTVSLDRPYTDLLTGQTLSGEASLPPNGVLVLR
jgi:beta-galactosidase GanA